jgi:hypothetical protein
MSRIERLLEEECAKEIEELGRMSPSQDEYKATVDGISKLTDRMIELKKIEIERDKEAKKRELEAEAREFEESCKLKQIEDERKDRFVKNCLTGVSVVGGLGCAVVMGLISMNFEKEGTFTTEAGRNSIRQLLKFKF